MTETLIAATFGGMLIGLSATLLMLINGRIAGISGIFGGLFSFNLFDRLWRIGFLAGLIAAPFAVRLVGGNIPVPEFFLSGPLFIISGILVGLGTQMGSGCTSGHGVCGISRFSKRSIAATLIFMSVAIVTVFITRHVIGVGS